MGKVGGIVGLPVFKYLHQRLLSAMQKFCLSNKEPVIVSTVVHFHGLRKQWEIKTVSIFKDFITHSAIDTIWISLMAEVREKSIGWDCRDGCMSKQGDEKWMKYGGRKCWLGVYGQFCEQIGNKQRAEK